MQIIAFSTSFLEDRTADDAVQSTSSYLGCSELGIILDLGYITRDIKKHSTPSSKAKHPSAFSAFVSSKLGDSAKVSYSTMSGNELPRCHQCDEDRSQHQPASGATHHTGIFHGCDTLEFNNCHFTSIGRDCSRSVPCSHFGVWGRSAILIGSVLLLNVIINLAFCGLQPCCARAL
ncbi:hypothetical protein BKA70DRAFT_454393 [Coprinopsis sp. MPI-PUGE-AT-0042]|nr:hypothetical protein BKA70DRAFT_454393 [Coprinopsis sp. MPI-PUGE-AT-0042]